MHANMTSLNDESICKDFELHVAALHANHKLTACQFTFLADIVVWTSDFDL